MRAESEIRKDLRISTHCDIYVIPECSWCIDRALSSRNALSVTVYDVKLSARFLQLMKASLLCANRFAIIFERKTLAIFERVRHCCLLLEDTLISCVYIGFSENKKKNRTMSHCKLLCRTFPYLTFDYFIEVRVCSVINRVVFVAAIGVGLDRNFNVNFTLPQTIIFTTWSVLYRKFTRNDVKTIYFIIRWKNGVVWIISCLAKILLNRITIHYVIGFLELACAFIPINNI